MKKNLKEGADIVNELYLINALLLLVLIFLLLRSIYSASSDPIVEEFDATTEYIEIEYQMKVLASTLSTYSQDIIKVDNELQSKLSGVSVYGDKIIYGDPYMESLNSDASSLDYKLCELNNMIGKINDQSDSINKSLYDEYREVSEINKLKNSNRNINKDIKKINIIISDYNSNLNERLILIHELKDIEKDE